MPQLSIDTVEITRRLRELANAQVCERCEPPVTDAIIDIARLLIQVERLYLDLARERLRSANLEAAIRAALSAANDGETDPLAYLRWEIAGNSEGTAYGT